MHYTYCTNTMWLYFALTFVQSLECVQPNHINIPDKNWDLLIFTLCWPETVCKIWEEVPSHTCLMPQKEDKWTIHGLWPTKLGTWGPAFCNETWLFDPEDIRPIETLLNESWINIHKETPHYSFWAHQWEKHGTCAVAIEPLNSQIKYFTKNLDFHNRYTMSDILREANIVPSDNRLYMVEDFHIAIMNTLGVNPAVQCYNQNGIQYLHELRICFNKALEITDCDGVSFEVNNTNPACCKPLESIVYPPHRHQRKGY